MFVVHTTIPLEPERREEAMELIADLVDRSRTEDGTVRYRAMQDLTNPDVVRFFEQYDDVAAAEEHTESDQYRAFVAALPDLASGRLETVQFETDDVQVFEYDAADATE